MNSEMINAIGVFFNPLVSWITKIKYIFIILILLLFADSRFGFSYHYFNQRKIEEIESISKILNDKSLDSTTKIMLQKVRSEYISKDRSYINYTLKVDDVYSLLSIAFLHILIIALSPILLTMGVNRYNPKSEQISQIVGVSFVMIIEAAILYSISRLTKTVLPTNWFYTVNIILQIFTILFTFWLSNRHNKSAQF